MTAVRLESGRSVIRASLGAGLYRERSAVETDSHPTLEEPHSHVHGGGAEPLNS